MVGFSIKTNVSAGWLSNSANTEFGNFISSMRKLSSGLRINSGADDPAGLVISEQLRSRIASLNQEIENTSAQISKYETASSQVMEMRSKLTEMRTLAIGAANEGFNSEAAQQAYANTANYIADRFNADAANASYNGIALFDGSETALGEVTELTGVDLSTPQAAQDSIAAIDEKIAEIDALQVDIGATQKNELESQRRSLEVTSQNLQAAESQLRDTDFAMEYSSMVGNLIRMQSSLALMSHHEVSSKGVFKLLSS